MRVNMDSSIATDPRFKVLAEDLGCTRNEVVGALFYVWLACYERRSERLSHRLADASAEIHGFGAALVVADLADNDGDELVLHGVTERIAFLRKQAERGRKGGRKGKGIPKVKSPKADAKQSPSARSVGSKAYTPALAPDPAPTQPPAVSACSDARAHVGHLVTAERLWQQQEASRYEIRQEGIDPTARSLGAAVSTSLHPIRELLDDGRTVEQCEHVLAVYAAEARRTRSLKHFNGTTNWKPEQFSRALAMPVEAAPDPNEKMTTDDLLAHAEELKRMGR